MICRISIRKLLTRKKIFLILYEITQISPSHKFDFAQQQEFHTFRGIIATSQRNGEFNNADVFI